MHRSKWRLRASDALNRAKQSRLLLAADGVVHAAIAVVATRRKQRRHLAIAIRRLAYEKRLRWLARRAWRRLTTDPAIVWESASGAQCPSRIKGVVELHTSVILRAPNDSTKGVIYLSFELNLIRLLQLDRLTALSQEYFIHCATSWCPTDFGILESASRAMRDPLFVGISNDIDVSAYSVGQDRLIPSNILASDWVDPSSFVPLPLASRDIDIILVGHFATWKRHWILFEALRSLPAHLNIVIVGRDIDGRSAETLMEEARAFDVRQQVTIFCNIPIEGVRELLCRSKLKTILSLTEGSCVAVAEALAADCPIVMLDESRIGSAKYVTNQTGTRVVRSKYATALSDVLSCRDRYTPRDWYIAHSGAHRSTLRLQQEIWDYEATLGHSILRPLAGLRWSYVPERSSTEHDVDILAAERRLSEVHGITFKRFQKPDRTTVTHTLHRGRPGIQLMVEE